MSASDTTTSTPREAPHDVYSSSAEWADGSGTAAENAKQHADSLRRLAENQSFEDSLDEPPWFARFRREYKAESGEFRRRLTAIREELTATREILGRLQQEAAVTRETSAHLQQEAAVTRETSAHLQQEAAVTREPLADLQQDAVVTRTSFLVAINAVHRLSYDLMVGRAQLSAKLANSRALMHHTLTPVPRPPPFEALAPLRGEAVEQLPPHAPMLEAPEDFPKTLKELHFLKDARVKTLLTAYRIPHGPTPAVNKVLLCHAVGVVPP